MLNERSPSVSPYPQRSSSGYPASQQTLYTAPPQAASATKAYLLNKVKALLPYLN